MIDVAELGQAIDRIAAETRFSGVVRVDLGDEVVVATAYGAAHRPLQVLNTIDTQFGLASGTKGFTALTIIRLVEKGVLELSTPARALLGTDLPLIDDRVTVEHLLAHRSGIGDYLDEDVLTSVTDYVMTAPLHELATTDGFLPMLAGHPAKFAPDEGFSYCNGGYVVLALLAERATGTSFHELVDSEVCKPAGLGDTEFLRSDELPARAALGYLGEDGARTNVLHLPVRGNGDGGIYSTAADVRTLWSALFEGRIVSPASVAQMIRPRSDSPSDGRRYGLGFWLHASTDAVILIGSDAGVSFQSACRPSRQLTTTVISNRSGGAWPLAAYLDQLHST